MRREHHDVTPFERRLESLLPILEEARHELWYGDDPIYQRITDYHRRAVSMYRRGKVRVAHNLLDAIESITGERP